MRLQLVLLTWSTPHRYVDNPKTVERKVAVKI